MNLVSSPGALNLSGNLPKILLTAVVAETVAVTLKKNGVNVLQESYSPDAEGKIEIDYQFVIDGLLKLEIPTFQSSVFAQLNGVALFEVTLNSSTGGSNTFSFKVVKGGVDAALVDQAIFLNTNFLTWQPQTKEIKFYDPEFLTYYSANASKIVVKGYLANGTSQTADLITIAANSLVTVNVNYGHINTLIADVIYYDVWVEESGARVSYIQRYILTNTTFDIDNVFVFENTLGGIDTIRLTGELEEKNISEFSTAIFDEVVLEYDVKVEKSYTVNSGYLKNDRYRQWSVEFINSSNKYYLNNGTLTRVFSNKPEISSVKGELPSFEIEFILSKQSKYSNLNRNDQALPALQIETQLGEVFFLAPRLNEFPWANDGDALIPVQYPFEDFWRKISLPSLVSRMTSELSAYVDHPVKTNSDVRHKSITSTNYVSGAAGSGWQIDKDGNATVDSLTVRKALNIFELVLNKLSATNGALAISDSIKIFSVTESEFSYECFIDTDEENISVPFQLNDLIRCQVWNGQAQKYYLAKVTAIGATSFTLDKATIYGGSIPAANDVVVRFGNTTNLNRQGLIYLTSSDVNSPYIDILDGVDSADLAGKTIGRFGNLEGITDEVFGPLEGNGIYLNRAYIADAIFSGIIRSIDGQSYLNLNDNKFMFKDLLSAFDLNVTNPGALTLTGAFIQRSGGGESFPIPIFRGPYLPGTFYYKGDTVTNGGSTWTYINNAPAKGKTPVEGVYWTASAVKGNNGTNGINGVKGNNGARLLFITSESSTIAPALDLQALNPEDWFSSQPPTKGGGELITIEGGFVIEIDASLLVVNKRKPFLWSTTELLDTNGAFLKWSLPIRVTPVDGKTGPLPIGGDLYDEDVDYIGSDFRVSIVRYDDGDGEKAYSAKPDAGTFKGVLPTDTEYWNAFGGQFESLATKLFFAEKALVKNLVVENWQTDVAPNKRFVCSKETNNISHYSNANAKIGEWDDDSALADDFYHIDIESDVSNLLFYGANRTLDHSAFNSGSFNSYKNTEDDFEFGFPRGYTGIKFLVSGSTYRYFFRHVTAGVKIGNPDDDFSFNGQATLGRNLVTADSIVSKGAFATGFRTITADYILDTYSVLHGERDHTLFYQGSADIDVELPIPYDDGLMQFTAENMKNANLGREIRIINKGTGDILVFTGWGSKIITNTASPFYIITPKTSATFILMAVGDNPLAISNYYWVLE